ncbi:thioredoxin [Archaeoglobales archaeon]|nr:MAG: thioredoxin [Archaeoglobales archaeon]
MRLIELTSENFDKTIQENEMVLVDVWAEWCAPCKAMAPVFSKLAEKYANKIIFAELDADKNVEIIERFKIKAIPTYLFFKKGELIDVLVGAMPKEEFKKWIERNI